MKYHVMDTNKVNNLLTYFFNTENLLHCKGKYICTSDISTIFLSVIKMFSSCKNMFKGPELIWPKMAIEVDIEFKGIGMGGGDGGNRVVMPTMVLTLAMLL